MTTLDLQLVAEDRIHSVTRALREDVGDGDITAALIPGQTRYHARVIAREPAVICGVDWVKETFLQVDPAVELAWHVGDGERVSADQPLFEARGPARAILTAERTALNFLQLLSGTATEAARYADAVAGTDTRVLDTRKTLPGLRTAQKYAVSCGGCQNHRIGLYDAYLIKENHIAACGSISDAVATAKQQQPGKPVEVEVENLEEFSEALDAGADIIMLDELSLADMREAVSRNRAQQGQRAMLEASGSISLQNIRAVARTGVDYISVGGLTKHLRAIDLSMRFIDTGQ